MQFIALALATALGTGYIPFAPGTFGSLVGLLLWWALPHGAAAQLTAILVLFIAGAWSGSYAERHFNRSDPGHVVLDEVVGMLITLFMSPVAWSGALLGFLLFRAADIVKPYPADRLEALHGGVGIMADDAMAAVYANIALRLLVLVAGRLNWTL